MLPALGTSTDVAKALADQKLEPHDRVQVFDAFVRVQRLAILDQSRSEISAGGPPQPDDPQRSSTARVVVSCSLEERAGLRVDVAARVVHADETMRARPRDSGAC